MPWLTRRPSRAVENEQITPRIHAGFLAGDRPYGARRVWPEVLAQGIHCGLHRIERLMRQQGLRARPRRRGLPLDKGQQGVSTLANILDGRFEAEQPNQKWTAGFTYIRTAEGWLYVAAGIDFSPAVLLACR